MDTKLKYVRTKNNVIIFGAITSHDTFKYLAPISAGFCHVNKNEVVCFGDSFSLDLKSNPKEDSLEATKQLFGYDAMISLMNNYEQRFVQR